MNSIKTLKHTVTLSLAIIVLANCSSEDTLTNDWIESNTTESNLTLGTLDASNFIWLGASISAGLGGQELWDCRYKLSKYTVQLAAWN